MRRPCRRAIDFDPASPEPYFWRGVALFRRFDDAAAIADWKKTLELDSSYGAAYEVLGRIHHERGEYDESVAYLTRLIEQRPNYGEAYYDRGRSYLRSDDREYALRDFRRACRLGYEPACLAYDTGGSVL